jgi:two-component system chemotaxis sensor kinase CheA
VISFSGYIVDDLIAEFLIETNESLEVVDAELVKFEANPSERKTLDNIFRLVHTVKGTCGFLGLPRLEAVAHAGETLLGRFRDGKLEVTPTAVTLVLQSIDRIKDILGGLEQTGSEPAGDDSALIGELEAMSEGRHQDAVAETPAEPEHPEGYDPVLGRVLRPGEVSAADLEAAFQNAEAPEWMEPEAVASDAAPEPVAVAAPKSEPKPAPKAVPVAEKPAAEKPAAEAAAVDDVASIKADQSIRVNVDVLEGLMTLVSEMVLTRNQLLQISRNTEDSEFASPLARLSTLTGELQDSVMKTRMQPIGAAWKKLPRLVRDLSHELDKKIDLVMDGENTELDRQVLELIRDPLTHMVRNSADHGLESTEERLARGKPASGTIKLSAFHEGGYIVIRISDNGRGLNTPRIRDKLVEKGLISRAEADTLTDQQIHRYIFAPGFSTAAKVTSVSGRGVGMDVVRNNIEQIGGQIDLVSNAGLGTTFTIKIPLTLAIVSALIVGAGKQKFAVPQTAVLELVRTGGTAEHRIEKINDSLVLRLREQLLPLVQLGPTLQLEEAKDETPPFVMVIQVGESRYGLVVNDVLDTEEIVVKSLASILRDVSVFSGATILGDGSVVLILDPNAMSERAGHLLEDKTEEGEETNTSDGAAQKVAVLLFKAGYGAPKAVELSQITRLEQVEVDKIEMMDGRMALQYRGRLMPILTVNGAGLSETGIQPLLVFSAEGFPMALAVDEIVDVVEEVLTIELSPDRSGARGTAIIAGKACEIIDTEYYQLRGLAEHTRPASNNDYSEERFVA